MPKRPRLRSAFIAAILNSRLLSATWALALIALFAIGPSVVISSEAVAVGQSSYSLMSTSDSPPSNSYLGGGCWVLAVKIHTSQAGTVTTLRWYASTAGETARGRVNNASGTAIVDVTFPTSTAAGWTSVTLPTPVAISANTDFWISYWSYSGRFYQGGTYTQPSSGPLSIIGTAAGTNIQFPNITWGTRAATTNYWIDLDFVPLGPPGEPTAVSAFAANGSATVSWTVPTSTGGSAITGYSVASSPAGASCNVTGTYASCTGLTNGTGYTFRVKAANSVGDSEESSASNSVTPQSFTSSSLMRGYIPSTFQVGSDIALSLGLRLTTTSAGEITAIRFFKHIANTGLHTAYVWNSAGTILGQQDFTAETGSGWQQVTLTNPVRVAANSTFTVGYHMTRTGYPTGSFPQNSSGPLTVVSAFYDYTLNSGQFPAGQVAHQYAIDLDFTSLSVPSAPTSVTASAGNARASVDWNAPSSNGGALITGYTVTSSPAGASCSVSGTSATCTGLSNGTGYRFTVKATNSVGDSVASSPSASVTPSAPAPAPVPVPEPEPVRVVTPTPVRTVAPIPQAVTPPPTLAPVPFVVKPLPTPVATRPLAPAPSSKPTVNASATAMPLASPSASATQKVTPGVSPAPGASGVKPLSPSADPVAAAKVFAAAAAAVASTDAPPLPVEVPEGGLFGGGTSGPKVDVNLGLTIGARAAGSPVSIQASDLQPNSPVQVVVHSEPQVIATSQVNASGEVAIETSIPSGLPAGAHTVVVQAIGADGQPVQIMGAMQIDENGIVTGIAPPAESGDAAPGGEAMTRALEAGKPLYDVASQPAVVATIAAAGATIAAVAGAAGAAGAAGSGGSTGTGGTSGGSGGNSSSDASSDGQTPDAEKGKSYTTRRVAGAAAATSIAAGHESGHEAHGHAFRPRDLAGVVIVGAALGDSSSTWRLPFTDAFHDGIDKFAAKASRFSIILPRALADGAWARAMFGSGAQLLWLAGVALGLLSLMQTGFQAIPASTGILLGVMALGILDAMAGLLAWSVIVLGALFTGHIREIPDFRASVGLALIAMTLSMLANYIRPLRRKKSTGIVHVFDRVTDYIIPPVVIAFAAVGMAKALNGLSGLEIIGKEETFAIQIVAGLAVLLRLGLEDLAVHLYPQRCVAVTTPDLQPPSVAWRLAAILARTVITVLVLSAFIGMNWFTMLLALLLAVPLVLRIWVDRIPNLPALRRWTPRGLVKICVTTIASVYLAKWIFSSSMTTSLLPAAMGLLLVPTAILSIVDTFARSGGDWDVGEWQKRLAGIAVWVLCGGVITGFIVLVH